MRRFKGFSWDDCKNEKTILILSEDDIKNENGIEDAGFEILILPSKYRAIQTQFLIIAKHLATVRGGEVIYV